MPASATLFSVKPPVRRPRLRARRRCCRSRHSGYTAALLALLWMGCGEPLLRAQQTPLQMVTAMVHNEQKARVGRNLFRYTSEERSSRTGGHLWTEKVVETPDGLLRRLVAEDGKPLSPSRAAAEDRRIAGLAADPEEFRATNSDRRADEARIARLLDILPRAFLLTAEGIQGDCARVGYKPNPNFIPSSYDERVVHEMAGTVLIHTPDLRLCGIDGHLVERVSFGYGLLGHIEKGSRFSLTRKPVTPVDWKSTHISVHMDGKILLLKSISRDQEVVHTDEQMIPPHLSLTQAAALTRS